MKKRYIILLCAAMTCMCVGGCMGKGDRISKWLGSEQEIADQIMVEIAKVLDKEDEKALKKMFSETSLNKAEDIDGQIKDIMDFYQGEMQSCEGNSSSETHTKHGEDIEKTLVGQYLLVTDARSYRILYDYVVINQKEDEVGLRQLEIVPDELYQKDDFDWVSGLENRGVFIQE